MFFPLIDQPLLPRLLKSERIQFHLAGFLVLPLFATVKGIVLPVMRFLA